jgi:hypothetical protein
MCFPKSAEAASQLPATDYRAQIVARRFKNPSCWVKAERTVSTKLEPIVRIGEGKRACRKRRFRASPIIAKALAEV